jgi:hypothetical protein
LLALGEGKRGPAVPASTDQIAHGNHLQLASPARRAIIAARVEANNFAPPIVLHCGPSMAARRRANRLVRPHLEESPAA